MGQSALELSHGIGGEGEQQRSGCRQADQKKKGGHGRFLDQTSWMSTLRKCGSWREEEARPRFYRCGRRDRTVKRIAQGPNITLRVSSLAMATLNKRILLWLKRIALGLLALVGIAVAVGAVWEWSARSRTARQYPPPGQQIDIGGRRIHIDCRGQGSPAVIFESGLDAGGSLSWDRVHDPVAALTRACVYDRAGVMWSDPTPGAQDAESVADDLHAVLKAAHIEGPVVLVAHSLGGPYAMTFTRKYGNEVAGYVFVDTSHPDQLTRLDVPSIMAVQKQMEEGLWMSELMARLSWTGALRAMGSNEPEIDIPGMTERTRKVSAAYLSQTLMGTLKEQRSMSRTFAQAGQLRSVGDRPLVVLTAGALIPADMRRMFNISEQDARDFKAKWIKLQAEEASWSSRSCQQIVTDSTHYIQDARPDLVVTGVAEVMKAIREGGTPAC